MNKKWYICGIAALIICVSVGFITANKSSVNHTDTEYIEYESFSDTDADMAKKDEYIRLELEARLQDTIQQMVEGCDPSVSIQNLNAEDDTETTASVTLNMDQGKDISDELLESVEILVLKSTNGLRQENININIKNVEQ